jgi:hypothetical protein
MNNEGLHSRTIIRRYIAEMSASFLLYALVLIASIEIGRPLKESLARTLILISPMIPFMLMIAAIVRQFRRMDEYLRLQMLENVTIAAGITAGWTFTYGFLENAGFPRLSMFHVMPVMFWIWGVLAIVRHFANR